MKRKFKIICGFLVLLLLISGLAFFAKTVATYGKASISAAWLDTRTGITLPWENPPQLAGPAGAQGPAGAAGTASMALVNGKYPAGYVTTVCDQTGYLLVTPYTRGTMCSSGNSHFVGFVDPSNFTVTQCGMGNTRAVIQCE